MLNVPVRWAVRPERRRGDDNKRNYCMKQLGVLDTAFINLEHPNTPQHVGGLGIYDPSTAPGGFVRF